MKICENNSLGQIAACQQVTGNWIICDARQILTAEITCTSLDFQSVGAVLIVTKASYQTHN